MYARAEDYLQQIATTVAKDGYALTLEADEHGFVINQDEVFSKNMTEPTAFWRADQLETKNRYMQHLDEDLVVVSGQEENWRLL